MPGSDNQLGPLNLHGVFRLDNLISGRNNAANPLRFYSATILVTNDGFLPKTILIADDMFTTALSTGVLYEVSGSVVNRFHQYPPIIFPDYQTLPPRMVLYPCVADVSDDINVAGVGKVIKATLREFWKDTALVVAHEDWDASDLTWVKFVCEYICHHASLEGVQDVENLLGKKVRICGCIRGFCEVRDSWIITNHLTLSIYTYAYNAMSFENCIPFYEKVRARCQFTLICKVFTGTEIPYVRICRRKTINLRKVARTNPF
ncbi:uncharacterized protein MELLADRAFT_113911 [Melampsora larici-populina 98AG31]|uniref:Uncharacterized protein n=1 Tax=Melampsora larici-populina (strain 98AG31 / pathotype 3-4-7) TaxID=747676 RepID=F4SBF5_MELLP|nr:uncharacterized protein MELLADRAFT_113911 [Melampsora larici-populina 98AG31]EGF98020.1 hypothetical protein MELLADRAFT_113911 [Melampsora larici-populina 98AG31]